MIYVEWQMWTEKLSAKWYTRVASTYIDSEKYYERAMNTHAEMKTVVIKLFPTSKLITKTSLFKYIENFTIKKLKIFR